MVLMLLGIGLFAGITGSITSYFVGQGRANDGSTLAEELRALADLRSDGALTAEEFEVAKAKTLRPG